MNRLSHAQCLNAADRKAHRFDVFAPAGARVATPAATTECFFLRVGLCSAFLVILFGTLVTDPTHAVAAESAATGKAASERVDELDRWVPSIGIFGGFQQQSADGAIAPGMLDPAAPQCVDERVNCEINRQIQPNSDGDDELRRFRAGLSAELMTPRFARHPGVPRLFVHIDPILSEGFERSIAGNGSPGAFVEGKLAANATRSDAQAFAGQGSRVLAEVSPFILNVGVGLAFTLDVLDSRFRIKPSIEYVREVLTVTGQVNRVVQVAQIPRPATLTDFRFIALQARERQTYHALGPGLEIEVDSNRIGPVTFSPFIAGHGHYFFGNLDVTLRDTNEFNESATWRFSRDRWQWEARFGVRLRWTPN